MLALENMEQGQYELREHKDFESMRQNYALIKQLNPHMSEERYLELLRAIVQQGNYSQVTCSFDGRCLGLMGVWIGTQLWCGKFLEIDNFIVDESQRGLGIGKRLVEWAEARAKKESCAMMRLDSYVTLDQAHRFYFARGFKILGFHMVKTL